ncbi:DUF1294 domain-containing protein [Shewanella sp. 202IG2-18]|uniref:DUF1294 domain-containing protein n=1 Tax=Parashewanella hymeniacidonis TaxID=2807618 RepID=UPI0019606038|nr:DUF1294 domain-containing protein [Parashewanella hymeniacidonis]MBM7073169.1 DUF1294 domain-containing protein [Parashewanella hymeniacidonis]
MSRSEHSISLFIAYCFILIFSVGLCFNLISKNLLLWYGLLTVISFAFYAWDKFQAKKDGWRIPEKHLHVLSLVGGWFGALLAQHWLRHKTSKVSFRRLLWLTILVNIAGLIWVHSQHFQWLLTTYF